MEGNQCQGALSPYEIRLLEEDTILRLYTCGHCGKRNLYAIKDCDGHWGLEPHSQPQPRILHEVAHETRG
jgi:hypothetical protein